MAAKADELGVRTELSVKVDGREKVTARALRMLSDERLAEAGALLARHGWGPLLDT